MTSLQSGDIVGQAGIEKVYNKLLMGEDGAKARRRQQQGREIRTLEEDAADRRPPRAVDRSTTTCRRPRKTASATPGSTARR